MRNKKTEQRKVLRFGAFSFVLKMSAEYGKGGEVP